MDEFAETHEQIRRPWNKGKVIGARPPLRPRHVWAVRTRLQLLNRIRDLALFDLAIDSKLRGCDVVGLKVVDVAPHGYALDRVSIRQRKTGRPVRFEITEQTRQAIDEYLQRGGAPGPYLFPGRGSAGGHLTTRQYSRPEWLTRVPGFEPISGSALKRVRYRWLRVPATSVICTPVPLERGCPFARLIRVAHPNFFDYLPTRWSLGSGLLLPAESTFARKGHDDIFVLSGTVIGTKRPQPSSPS